VARSEGGSGSGKQAGCKTQVATHVALMERRTIVSGGRHGDSGAIATTGIAFAFGEPCRVCGRLRLRSRWATGYGISLRFYPRAQWVFGAARNGSLFAFAPFVGTLFAFLLEAFARSTHEQARHGA
jgi:hypothetical protein